MLSPNDWTKLPARRSFIYDPPPGLNLLYADAHVLVIDKPAGLLSVPGRELPDSAETRLRALHPETLLVHRLDMATSGVMIFARTKDAQRHLGLQFERRHTRKTYRADVAGDVHGESGHINLPLIADWPNRPRQMVSFERGKASQTDWTVLGRHDGRTQLSLHPITGRSHQLRVHCWAMGHPLLGDRIYAVDEVFDAAPRLFLHAETLEIHHPENGDRVSFHAPCPF